MSKAYEALIKEIRRYIKAIVNTDTVSVSPSQYKTLLIRENKHRASLGKDSVSEIEYLSLDGKFYKIKVFK